MTPCTTPTNQSASPKSDVKVMIGRGIGSPRGRDCGGEREHLGEQRPRAVHGQAREAAQVVADVAVARAALDARVVGAVARLARVRKEHRRAVAGQQPERGGTRGDRGVDRPGVAAHEGGAARLERHEARDRPARDRERAPRGKRRGDRARRRLLARARGDEHDGALLGVEDASRQLGEPRRIPASRGPARAGMEPHEPCIARHAELREGRVRLGARGGADVKPRHARPGGPAQRRERGEVEPHGRERARAGVMGVERRAPALVRVAHARPGPGQPAQKCRARIAEEVDREVRAERSQPAPQRPHRAQARMPLGDDQLVHAWIALEQGRALALDQVGDACIRSGAPHRVERGQREADVAEEARTHEQHPLHGRGVQAWGGRHARLGYDERGCLAIRDSIPTPEEARVAPSKGTPGRGRGPRTSAVHGPPTPSRTHGPVSTPIVHSSTFSFPDLDALRAAQDAGAAGAFYQRYGHPTLRACEERLAALEGAETGLLFSSGMAAISAVFLASLESGDHVVALRQCYGGTQALLEWGAERFGWTVDLVDAREPGAWARAFKARTRILHVESPTNPTLAVVDLEQAARLAHEHGALLTVDNTFASPVGQHPLALGADIVMHSATKSIGGHGDLLAGVVLGPAARLERVWKARKVFGPVPDPALAWQIERSLKTL